tara:strand:+ start:334 stop:525 length:192 start_codon:yes stop_codon:yes gene_type:complete
MKTKFFKITGRHTQIFKPEGKVITFWLAADSESNALKMCEDKGIIDIQKIEDDSDSHPWATEK